MTLRRFTGLTFAALLATAHMGCYKATIADTRVPDYEEAPRETRWESYFLWGLVGSPMEDTREMCGQGQPVLVRQDAGFGEWMVGFLTLGIYSPRRLTVGCLPVRTASTVRAIGAAR
jgi:Bor protein